MKPDELLSLLQEFHRERLATMLRHQAGARHVLQYDANNTYQYVLNREDVHLRWLASAIREMGGTVDNGATEPTRPLTGKGAAASLALIEEDARDAQACIDRWTARVEQVTNVRHRNMLRVILGEVLEQKRFFDQAVAGRTDLLGRRTTGSPVEGAVLETRWIE
ncbi:MAG: hypothetical protein KGN76_01535 [Acidobacteriota bacterium]|nr:hypothetical protein [Acidobacteriota bacterium]